MTYGRTAWELAADTHLMKSKRLQNKLLRIIGKQSRGTPICYMRMALRIMYVYEYITKLFWQQAQVIRNRENAHVRNNGQGEARHRKYKRLKLGGGHPYDCSSN
jgi:hypothetical protein